MIPNVFHFVWFGREFPLTHALALRSVHATNPGATIWLHHSDALEGQLHFDQLVRDVPNLRLLRLDPGDLLAGCEGDFDVSAIRKIYGKLLAEKRWAGLSDVVRYLVLLRHGGIYLDLDVIVVRDMTPLRDFPAFCGQERILVDGALFRSKLAWARFPRTAPLDLLRWLCAKSEQGIAWWKSVERYYTAAVNSAVMGAMPRHSLAIEALRAIPELVAHLPRRRPVIGPDLLQDLVRQPRHADVKVLPPAAFYPLGPTMAVQYFRQRADAAAAAAVVMTDETYVLHWYNDNLRDLPRPPDAESLRSLRQAQLFSYFAAPLLPDAS